MVVLSSLIRIATPLRGVDTQSSSEGTGIELVTAHFTEVSENIVHHNGEGGIQLRVGILATGAGTHDNRIEHNEVLDNYGRGVFLTRPAGTAPITGNLVAHNRVHGNYRGGIAIMDAATDNVVMHNDARDNNLSGLAPCKQCNLFDMSIGGNTWEKNHGTFNGTDACAQ